MRKLLAARVLAALVLLCLVFAGCTRQGTANTEPAFDYKHYDWLTHLKTEAFSEEGSMVTAVTDVIKLQVTGTSASAITVTVTAPNITQALLDWYDTQQIFSGEALESQIAALLKGEVAEQTFTLPYSLSGDVPVITYPDGYADALSCGLSAFYDILYARILEQMGGAAQ